MKDPIKVYDARWEVSEFNNAEVIRLFEASLGYAKELNINHVVLARDARLGCARVLELAVETAMKMGFKISLLTDPVSTPLSYFMALKASAEKYPQTMGLSVTASHNPRQYIGVKFTIPTVHAIGYNCGPKGGLKRIREIYHSNFESNYVEGGDLDLIDHPGEDYIDYAFKEADIKFGDLNGVHVVLDGFHGSSGPEVYQALRKAGAKVTALRLIPNGDFPTGSPNPTSQHKMDDTVALAKKIKADLVVGLDGDGDRIVFGDSRGILNAGFATIPLLKALKSENLDEIPTVLYDPKVNPIALEEWGKLNVKPVLFRNGHSQIKDFMVKSNALAAAEESGHYYHRLAYNNLVIAAENSIFTILLFLKELRRNSNLMNELWKKQNEVFTTGEFNYQFSDNDIRDKAMDAVINYFKQDGAAMATESDNGEDLEGTVVYKGVHISEGEVSLEKGWYSGYFRVATNEKGVVRSYLSNADPIQGKEIENTMRILLSKEFKGKEIE